MTYLEIDVGPSTYYFEPMSRFLDKPALTDAADATPPSLTSENFEPQAPTDAYPASTDLHELTDDAGEGLLGVQQQEFAVVRRVDTYRNPVDDREAVRTDMRP